MHLHTSPAHVHSRNPERGSHHIQLAVSTRPAWAKARILAYMYVRVSECSARTVLDLNDRA